MQEIIPAELLLATKKEDFLAWLRFLNIDKADKKLLLMYWCDRVGVKITGAMVRDAGIE